MEDIKRRKYSVGGAFVGVPVMLGANGVEKIIELNLNDSEKSQLDTSVSYVKELVTAVETMI